MHYSAVLSPYKPRTVPLEGPAAAVRANASSASHVYVEQQTHRGEYNTVIKMRHVAIEQPIAPIACPCQHEL